MALRLMIFGKTPTVRLSVDGWVDYPPVMVAVGRVPKHRPFALERATEDTP